MKKLLSDKPTLLYCLTFILLAAIYLIHAPHTVQTGDSGELTYAAFGFMIPHPPGYPLWVWINHIWIGLVSIGTNYFSFSILNILMSLIALWTLGKNIGSTSVKIFAILTLGLSVTYWRYSEIPEVFILNTLLGLAVISSGKSNENLPKTSIPVAATLMPLFYSLAVANHLSIVFLMPFVVWVCWKQRKSIWLYLSILLGMLICAGLYLSMLKMHPENLYSWRALETVADVWNHFLRKDYGTFLLTSKTIGHSPLMTFQFFFETLFFATTPLLILAGYTLYESTKAEKKIIWHSFQTAIAASIFIYVVIFFPMMNMVPVNFFRDVTERFFILPIALVILILSTFISENLDLNSKTKITILSSLVALFFCISYTQNTRYNDLSDNTIVEDYAYNILNISSEFKNPILIVSQDTQIFSIRYLQIVENVQPAVHVLPHAFFAAEWTLRKVVKSLPDLSIDIDGILKRNVEVTDRDVVLPNEGKYTFITAEDEFSFKTLKLTYLPLGIVLSRGSGFDTHQTKFIPRFRSDASIIDTSPFTYNAFRNVLAKYSYYFVAQGVIEWKMGHLEKALDGFERAFSIAPFTIQPLENLCKVKKELKIEDIRCDNIDRARLFFDYYWYNNFRPN